jgi:hypothetical protein
MQENRKISTEKEMLDQLREGTIVLPPLFFRFLGAEVVDGGERRFDAIIEASWQRKTAKFVVECKALSTPKAFQGGLNMLKTAMFPKGTFPMLFVPFLSEKQLQELEQEGISGIDLCGNGVVSVPGKFLVFRSGGKNRFPASAPIKNIYRKNSSMVGRAFLACAGYDTVQEILAEVNQRNILVNHWDKKPMSLSTVSKALKTLEEDLVVTRKPTIRLFQPDKLLGKLNENYESPTIRQRVRLKLQEESGNILELLSRQSQALGLPFVASGTSSVTRYAVMQRGEMLSVYCPRADSLLQGLPDSQSVRFPNLEIVETEDETVYFDARQEGDFWWASPVQVYLELMTGDKRDQETAEQVKSLILEDIEAEQQ